MTYRIITLGDSLTDRRAYLDTGVEPWIRQALKLGFDIQLIRDLSLGGSDSGTGSHALYYLNDFALYVRGLLGQIELLLALVKAGAINPKEIDLIVLWSGTNDLLLAIGCWPRVNAGVRVDASPAFKRFRQMALRTHTEEGFVGAIINHYTVPNIVKAVQQVREVFPEAEIRVPSTFDFSCTPMAFSAEYDLRKLTYNAVAAFENELEYRVETETDAVVIPMSDMRFIARTELIDLIHPGQEPHTEFCRRILIP